MYKVIRYFTDMQDNNHAYHVGDTYPRGGVTPSEERVRELLSGENKRHVKLIEEVVKTPRKGREDALQGNEAEPMKEAKEDVTPVSESEEEGKKPAKSKKKTKEG